MSVEDKIKKTIAEKLEVGIDDVVMKASFIDDLGADSLKIVELIMTMEEMFDIEIEDEEQEKLRTVENVIDFVKSRV